MVSSTSERTKEVPLDISKQLMLLAVELRKFSQDELIKRTGLDPTTVSNWLENEGLTGTIKLVDARWRIADYADNH